MNYKEIKQINTKLKEPFKKLRFEETEHKYWVEGDDRPIKSVSTHLKHFYDEFQTDIIAPKYARSRGLDLDDVRNAWTGEGDIANAHGTKVHLVGEDYVRWKFFQECERPEIFDKQSLATTEFINDLPDYLIPVATELQMYSEKYWFSGTADGILYNTRNGKFIIYDWKTNKSLVDDSKAYLKRIDRKHKLRQDNFGKYTLQFSFYNYLMKEAGFDVQSRILVWLNEDKDSKKLYRTYKTTNLIHELESFLDLGIHNKDIL